MNYSRLIHYPFFIFFLTMIITSVFSQAWQVLPPNLPNDKRLGPLKNLNDYFPFHPPETDDEWEKRAERLHRQVLVSNGLWPMPTQTPPNVVITGNVDRADYTVEKVFLESYPGLYVTGVLYRPKGRTGKLPGILSPHGHGGRLHDYGEKEIKELIAQGAERFEKSGRYPKQARMVQLARMGCVAFQWDMVGYADSQQLPHRPIFRPEMSYMDSWGFSSPQALARLQSFMGLQTYNSIRVLDWFSQLPDVDENRIGITGGSGGGTQTIILCAVDSRPKVAFPNGMVSTAMQGGCICENSSYLRVGTGNVELAALTAPRPLGMTAADDWTRELFTKGLPELKQLYEKLGVPELVYAKSLTQFGHNFNYVSRGVMYQWMNEHLKLGLEEPVVEEDYVPLNEEESRVWNEKYPAPAGGPEFERSLLRWMTIDSEKQMAALIPTSSKKLEEYRNIVGGAVDIIIGRKVPPAGSVEYVKQNESKLENFQLTKGLLQYSGMEEELPVIMLQTDSILTEAVIWIDPMGKRGIFDEKGELKGPIRKLLASNKAVIGVDLFGQGEFTGDNLPLKKARLNGIDDATENSRWSEYAGYTFGYNYPLFSKRVHDILSVISFLRHKNFPVKKLYLVGFQGAGHWVAAASAQAGSAIDGTVLHTNGFRFARINSFDDPDFLPGGAKYLDLPGMIALSTPGLLWLAGENNTPTVITAAYKASGQPKNLTVYRGNESNLKDNAVNWILQN